MLSWFVGKAVADAAVRDGTTVTAQQVERRATTPAALDDSVCLRAIRRYCDAGAWEALEAVVEMLENDTVWYCAACSGDIADEKCVGCDSCLQWSHFRCVGIKSAPKVRCWFCVQCRRG